MRYKNNSNATKTFYGVEFKPGDVKDVTGYINHPKFLQVSIDVPVTKEFKPMVRRQPQPKVKPTPQQTSTPKSNKEE